MAFYEDLSDKGNSLLSFLIKGASLDMSKAAVLRALQDKDLGYRETIFRKDYGIVLAAHKKFEGLRYIPGKETIGEEWYMRSTLPMTKNYQTVIDFDVLDTATGKEETMHISVMHDSLLSRAELEAKAQECLAEYERELEILDLRPVLSRRVAELRVV